MDDIDALNQHDTTMQSSLGMRPLQFPSPSHVAIVTSHPILSRIRMRTSTTRGWMQRTLDGVSDGVDWQQIFGGCRLVVVAIEYRIPETRLRHARMLFELESLCDATGCSFSGWMMRRLKDGRAIVRHKCHTSMTLVWHTFATMMI